MNVKKSLFQKTQNMFFSFFVILPFISFNLKFIFNWSLHYMFCLVQVYSRVSDN